jgi:steroid delta-isomerase
VSEALDQHVIRFNEGVRTGDFGPMLEGFTDDAELLFEGVPAGPFGGRDAIRAAYRKQPPDDVVVVLGSRCDGADEVATYAWGERPEVPAGEMRFTRRDGLVSRLVVSFFPEDPS